MNKDNIYKTIRAKGGRISKVRKALVEILLGSDCLMSQSEILIYLKKQKINPNRSTIFRELLFLAKNNIIIKNNISAFTINPYEMEDLFQRIKVLYENPELRTKLSGNAFEAVQDFDEKEHIKKMFRIYSEVLED